MTWHLVENQVNLVWGSGSGRLGGYKGWGFFFLSGFERDYFVYLTHPGQIGIGFGMAEDSGWEDNRDGIGNDFSVRDWVWVLLCAAHRELMEVRPDYGMISRLVSEFGSIFPRIGDDEFSDVMNRAFLQVEGVVRRWRRLDMLRDRVRVQRSGGSTEELNWIDWKGIEELSEDLAGRFDRVGVVGSRSKVPDDYINQVCDREREIEDIGVRRDSALRDGG